MRRRRTALALRLGALGCALAVGPAATEPLPSPLHDDDIPRILALGPWPPPAPRDVSNRVSGEPAAIAFGGTLFADARLSGSGKLSCASCHVPAQGFGDGRAVGVGERVLTRNTLGLANLAQQRWYGWDGANDNLWAQSLRPLLDPREMGSSLPHLAQQVRQQPDLRAGYHRALGAEPGSDDERIAVDLAKALAAYQETLVTPRTRFDDFRDAVARRDREAMAAYPAAAQRGLKIFVGKGRCYVCHGGPNLSNGEFADIGVPFFVTGGGVDPGRHGGIRALQASRYNLLGPFNDDPLRSTATSTQHVQLDHRHFGEFKVPSLRGLKHTAPYFHDGSARTLRDVVRHYSELNEERLHADGERILVPLRLSDGEVDDLLAFLDSLSAASAR